VDVTKWSVRLQFRRNRGGGGDGEPRRCGAPAPCDHVSASVVERLGAAPNTLNGFRGENVCFRPEAAVNKKTA
jgi:hypothetical protein